MVVLTEFKHLTQACTTQKARRAKLSTQICRGPQKYISFRYQDFVVVWKKFWNNYLRRCSSCNIFYN